MLEQYAIVPFLRQEGVSLSNRRADPAILSQHYGGRFLQFLEPLVRELDLTMDKRPLRTLVQTVEAIVAFRDRNHGLLRSRVGRLHGRVGGGSQG